MLFISSGALTKKDLGLLEEAVQSRRGPAKAIAVEGNPRAVIVKTSNLVAPLLRGEGGELHVGGKRLVSVLTSGAIVNLKKRAYEAAANGQVP